MKRLMLAGLYRFYGGKARSESLFRLAKLFLHYRSAVFMGFISMVGYNLFTAAPGWYIKDVVDSLKKGDSHSMDDFAIVSVGIIIIFAARGVFYYVHTYLIGSVAARLVADLRVNLFAHLHTLSFSFFTEKSRGHLITRFTNDLGKLHESLQVSVTAPLRDIPQVFFLLGLLFTRSWHLAMVSLAIIPLAAWLISVFGRRNNQFTQLSLSSFGRLTMLLVETISGIRVVKAFGMEAYEQKRYEEANQVALKQTLRMISVGSYSTPVLEGIGSIVGALIILTGGYLIIENTITAGDFASFLFTFLLLNDPIKRLNGFNLKMNEGLAAADRVFQLIDTRPDIIEKPGAVVLPPIRKEMKVDIQRHYYVDPEDAVLRNVKIRVPKGHVVALVGASGAGKTTLVNLIPRFFDVKEGVISIDGMDIQDVTISSLRAQMAIVTQEVFLFNDTVANNIAYGNIDCPKEQIEAAAKAAHAWGFIQNLPNGLDTNIGEGGMHLSGGQRQRISIARALIKNAPILILDEATSALDSESEKEVQKAIETLMADRTTIVIAHRLSTVQRANQIYVLDHGRVAEQGTHRDLLKKNGLYRKLYLMQFDDQAHSLASVQSPRTRAKAQGKKTENHRTTEAKREKGARGEKGAKKKAQPKTTKTKR
ncbi:MAG: ABC transporter transmembrane domain-containing protein [Deltaproteobacteria bacterium]|nr:ABC transporter transmembrane domain-containing protein [Deltaproteobacteria bacterium]